MKEHRLMDRIRILAKNPNRRFSEDPREMIRSIQMHLQRILNTRQGSVPIADDYGIPDFTDYMTTYPESQRDIERTLKQTIQKFEPRLRSVRVTFLPQDDFLGLNFEITARLTQGDRREQIKFESQIDPDGHIKITS